MLIFRSPPRVILKAAPSKLEQVVDRLAPKMERAIREATLRAQGRIDLEVLAANVEAGRVGRAINQLKLETFVAEDLASTMEFLVEANEAGRSLGAPLVLRKGDPFRGINYAAGKYYGSKSSMIEVASKVPGVKVAPVRRMGLSTLWGLQNDQGQWLGPQGWNEGVTAKPRGSKAPAPPNVPPSSTPGPLGFDLKTTNPRALASAEAQAARLLTAVNAETKQTVRDLIARAYREQITTKDTARLIRDVVGLNDRQATALFNYRAGLVEDGRAADQVERMTAKYGDRLLRDRAKTIAQTEVHRASAEGQHELWREGVREGRINPTTARRIWIANVGACDWCESVEEMNEDGVPIDGQFETPDGPIDGPEESHVGCRCSTGLEME